MKKAFTLIEILVVATIIGLLAAAAAASYTSLSKSSRDSRRKADLENIRSAVEQYRSNNGSYPASSGGSGAGYLIIPSSCSTTSLTDSSSNTYLSQSPVDPKCPTYYYYYIQNSASDYTVGAYLENGSTTSTCGACTSGTACNYCLGPYGPR